MSFEQIFYAMFAMMYGMLLLCAWVLLDVIPVIHTDHGWEYIQSYLTHGILAFLSGSIFFGLLIGLGIWLA